MDFSLPPPRTIKKVKKTYTKNTSVENPKDLSFEYMQKTKDNSNVKGVFAFSFYIHSPEDITKNQYLKGLSLYYKSLTKPDSVFANWKILIYTDTHTLNVLKENNHSFMNNPAIDFVLVHWPYYQPENANKLNGDIIRIMRFRAFFDFPTIPVFVRDADTLMAQDDYQGKHIPNDPELIYKWEKNFLEGAMSYPNTLFFGTSGEYKKYWHKNTLTNINAPFGAFAGFQSTIPNVPCFQSESLWNECVDYIIRHSKRLIEHPSEQLIYSNYSSVGKDEQILLFVILPKCMENIFFFELDIFQRRMYTLNGVIYTSPEYPKKILARGSNQDIKQIFQSNYTNFLTIDKLKYNKIKGPESKAQYAAMNRGIDVVRKIWARYGRLGSDIKIMDSVFNAWNNYFISQRFKVLSEKFKGTEEEKENAKKIIEQLEPAIHTYYKFNSMKASIRELEQQIQGYFINSKVKSEEYEDLLMQLDEKISLLPELAMNTIAAFLEYNPNREELAKLAMEHEKFLSKEKIDFLFNYYDTHKSGGRRKTRKQKRSRLYNGNPSGKPQIKGLGFSSAEKAKESLKKIKHKPLTYQKQVMTTMYYRAKHHPHKTRKIRNAMKIYKDALIRKH